MLIRLSCVSRRFCIAMSAKQSGMSSQHERREVQDDFLPLGYEVVAGAPMEGYPHLMQYESESQWYVEHYSPPDQGLVRIEGPPEDGNDLYSLDDPEYNPFDRPPGESASVQVFPAAKAKAVGKPAPRRPAIRYREKQMPEKSFPETQAKVLTDDVDGPYVDVGTSAKLVSFSDSKVLHFRRCGAVHRNMNAHLVAHEYEHCACLDRLFLKKETIRDGSNVIHGFPFCAHIKGNKVQQKDFRPCRTCLQIPKLY